MVNTIWLSGQKGLKYYRKMEACQQISDCPSPNGIKKEALNSKVTHQRTELFMSLVTKIVMSCKIGNINR